MKGWDDALDMQNDVRRSLLSPAGQRYLNWYVKGQSMAISHGMRFELGKLTEPEFRGVTSSAVASVEHGVPVWVSDEVLELVTYAAEKVDPPFQPEAIQPDDIFTPDAFCLLERTLRTIDIEGRDIAFRAVSWVTWTNPRNPGDRYLTLALWSHADDDDAYTNAPSGFPRRVAGCPLVLKHVTSFRYADPKAMADQVNHTLFRQIQIMWRLAKQEIVVSGQMRVSRPTWRRKSNWRNIKTVQVLTLRRAKQRYRRQSEPTREYTHRFPVRGHWRNQWYPKQKRHYQIWIDAHVSPDRPELPFVAKQSAVEFTR